MYYTFLAELYHNMILLYVYVFIVHFVLIKISFAKTAIDISFHLQWYCGHWYYNGYVFSFIKYLFSL